MVRNSCEGRWEIRSMVVRKVCVESDFPQNLKELLGNGNCLEIESYLSMLNLAIEKVEENDRLCLWIEEIKATKKELFGHMVSVAILSELLAKWMGCSAEEIETAALAGFMHDIGLVYLMDGRKKKVVFKDELGIHGYEKHIMQANHFLKSLKVDPEVIKAVLAHHERPDGNGFPLKINGASINKIGKIVAIADVYDTYTMKIPGECNWSVLKALSNMEEEASQRLDASYLQVFIENILEQTEMRTVRLSDGSTAKIIMVNKYELLYPTVECDKKLTDLSISKRVFVEELL